MMSGHVHHGHNHDHDHHDHDHHDHDHHDHDLAGHEMPSILSLTKTINFENSVTGEWIRSRYSRVLTDLCRWAEENDYVIGHVKLCVTHDDHFLWLSTTGDDVFADAPPGWDAFTLQRMELRFTAIVLGVDEDTLKQKGETLLETANDQAKG